MDRSRQWRSVEELQDPEAFQALAEARFPSAFEGLTDVQRRQLLKVMGASLALAGVSACSPPPAPEARPYVNSPDGTTLGTPRFYASAVVFGGYAQPVLGQTHEGRPTKLDGLPGHPASGGTTDAFTQAALLDLYDPDRSRGPRRQGRPTDWTAFDAAMTLNAERLDRGRGEGLRLLTGATSSPTFARQLEAMQQRWPLMRWHVFEPVNEDLRLEAARLAFGRPALAHPRLDQCAAIVSFDDDLLGPGPRQTANALGWAQARRGFQQGREMGRLWVAEPAPSLTGAVAGERLIAASFDLPLLLAALAARLGHGEPPAQPLTPRQSQWLDGAARALTAARDAGLITVGARCDPQVQAQAMRLTAALGGLGRTLGVTGPVLLDPPDGSASFEVLARDLATGEVDTLFIIGANPLYAAPADLGFAEAFGRARLRVHAGLHFDETGAVCDWHAPLAHALETWSDARAVDGRPSLIQPLVRPFHDVRSCSALIETLQGRPDADPRRILAETWKDRLGGLDDPRWKQALARGFIDEPAAELALTPAAATSPAPPSPRPGGLTVEIRPDPTIWDGARANNAWLQELPKPFNKLTWDNAVLLAPALASSLGVKSGDVVAVTAGGRTVEGPAWITPGMERRTVVAHLGYGRNIPRQLGHGIGYDAFALRTTGAPWRVEGAALARTGRRMKLATTQPATAMDGYDFARTMPRASTAPAPPRPPSPSFYADPPRSRPQWGMAIDTDLCIGCNACVTACDAENNIPMVGKDLVAQGREMHWLRVDQYHEGPVDDPKLLNQPVPCMHCEQAPCEMGCPVNAAVHSHDGLNLQVYNRCIGTRTCSSFCPYKVRRFNWFDYTAKDPPELRAARNPEVTVRSRGVMEKCTYCVQRIEKARIDAKVRGSPLADGEVRTACQQACPTQAIVFGDMTDPQSQVARAKSQRRNYALLEEANTRPSTTYLARLEDG